MLKNKRLACFYYFKGGMRDRGRGQIQGGREGGGGGGGEGSSLVIWKRRISTCARMPIPWKANFTLAFEWTISIGTVCIFITCVGSLRAFVNIYKMLTRWSVLTFELVLMQSWKKFGYFKTSYKYLCMYAHLQKSQFHIGIWMNHQYWYS